MRTTGAACGQGTRWVRIGRVNAREGTTTQPGQARGYTNPGGPYGDQQTYPAWYRHATHAGAQT